MEWCTRLFGVEGEMGRDPHMEREERVVRRFADVCPLGMLPESIEKREPPEPEVLCKLKSGDGVALELVEAIDERLAPRESRKSEMAQALRDAYEALPGGSYPKLQQRFGNALVHVTFHERATVRRSRAAIPHILRELETVNGAFAGDVVPDRRSPLGQTVRKVCVRRGDYAGPCFDVESTGSFADPVVNRIEDKFENDYQSTYPIELLVYYELQPVLPENTWLPELERFVRERLVASPFRRVWVFDLAANAIMFVHPAVDTRTAR
jgi:hypothetical protein